MPWSTQWNLSTAYDFRLRGTHKLTLRADVFNVLNVLHYSWGGYSQIINTNPYNVTGFDQASLLFLKFKGGAPAPPSYKYILLRNLMRNLAFIRTTLNTQSPLPI